MNPRYYFIQFWSVKNPDVLTYQDLRELLYIVWLRIWNEVPGTVETKLKIVGDRFEHDVKFGQCNIETEENGTRRR